MIKGVLFDLGDTLIAEIEGPADIDTTEFEVLDGTEEVLEALSKDYRLAIVSNTLSWGDEDVRKALARKDLTRFFKAIVTSVGAQSWKPDGAIFQKALRLIDCRPEETVMIGDRIETDISGANKHGITSVLCRTRDRYPVTSTNEDDMPDYIIGSLRDLPELLSRLQ